MKWYDQYGKPESCAALFLQNEMGNRGINFWRLPFFFFFFSPFPFYWASKHQYKTKSVAVTPLSLLGLGGRCDPRGQQGGPEPRGSGRCACLAGAAVAKAPLKLINLAVVWGCQSSSDANQLQKVLRRTWATGIDQQMNCTAIRALNGNSFACI